MLNTMLSSRKRPLATLILTLLPLHAGSNETCFEYVQDSNYSVFATRRNTDIECVVLPPNEAIRIGFTIQRFSRPSRNGPEGASSLVAAEIPGNESALSNFALSSAGRG